jgi:ferredoxin
VDVVSVDQSLCEGHGKCYLVAPDLFRPMDDLGHAEFHGAAIDPSDGARVAEANGAIDACPAMALSWAGGEASA